MRLRDIATCATATLFAVLVLLPAAAGADTPVPGTSSGGASADLDQPFLSGNGGAMVGKQATVVGRIAGTHRGQSISVDAQLPGAAWTPVATGTVGGAGTFTAHWLAKASGHLTVRASAGGGSEAPLTADLIVHKASRVTWFGPSDNGATTACGVPLTATVLGVAHKTLPCGTQVSFLFHGRAITVPVIDRGPYTHGVDWDLTEGAANALGFADTGVGTVGVLTLRDEPLARLAVVKKKK